MLDPRSTHYRVFNRTSMECNRSTLDMYVPRYHNEFSVEKKYNLKCLFLKFFHHCPSGPLYSKIFLKSSDLPKNYIFF